MDDDLLDILACPETHQPLKRADESVLSGVNARIKEGDLKNRGGKDVSDAIDEGLVREDGKVLYPVREGIPFLLIDEGIEITP